jgi:16S rRNA (adenine1518-N6/adenine1519-N6)-dimethyltransferase
MSDGPRPGLTAPLVDPAAVRRTLRDANLRARHSLSQNFLVDTDVLEGIVVAAGAEPGDRVLEIGPGLGILTGALLAAGAAVTAVEVDRGLAAWLAERHAREIAVGIAGPESAGSLRLVEGDVLDEDLAALMRPPFLVVANLPYHITSPVLHRLLELPRPPDRMVLMVQREVAQRIAAPPGGMSYLSVFVQFHARVRIVLEVPRTAFEPAPKVDSSVVVIEPPGVGADGAIPSDAEDDLWRLVQAGFRERRKMLKNVLGRQLPIDAAAVERALATAGIAGDRRPQTLSVGDWIRLLLALGPIPADRRGRRDE